MTYEEKVNAVTDAIKTLITATSEFTDNQVNVCFPFPTFENKYCFIHPDTDSPEPYSFTSQEDHIQIKIIPYVRSYTMPNQYSDVMKMIGKIVDALLSDITLNNIVQNGRMKSIAWDYAPSDEREKVMIWAEIVMEYDFNMSYT